MECHPSLYFRGGTWKCPALMPFHMNVVCVRDEDDNLLCSITHANHMKPHMIKHLHGLHQRWSKMGGMTPVPLFPHRRKLSGQLYDTKVWQWWEGSARSQGHWEVPTLSRFPRIFADVSLPGIFHSQKFTWTPTEWRKCVFLPLGGTLPVIH